MSVPRGIRNNNPGNIRHGSAWRGLSKDQTDDSFCVFDDPVMGLRALGKVLINYERLHGFNTVNGIINRYAPPVENDTNSYAEHVANKLGVGLDEEIDVSVYLDDLMSAIVKHENGQQPYTAAQIAHAANLARA